MLRSISMAAVAAVLCLAACAPEIPPDPKPSDGFSGAEKAAVDEVFSIISATFPEPQEVLFRDPLVSDVEGEGRFVCLDAAMPGDRWTGFVATKAQNEEAYHVVREKDALSPKARPQCRALVLKYLGEQDVDWYDAEVAYNKAGCAHLDTAYWEAWKLACNGKITRPAKTPKPAA